MFEVDEITGKARLTQGDTAYVKLVPLDADGDFFMMEPGDKLVFTIAAYDVPRVVKNATIDNYDEESESYVVKIEKEDTENLQPIVYDYDVFLITNDGDRYTFVPKLEFEILPAVSR